MERTGIAAALLRFGAGTAGSTLLGLAVFSTRVFDPSRPAFECVSVGALAAGMLALVRGRRRALALSLAPVFALAILVASLDRGTGRAMAAATSALVIGAGAFITALLFDVLDDRGIRFSKFLATGPMLGGVHLAASPLQIAALGVGREAFDFLILSTFIGVVVGHGVGAAVEIVELAPRSGTGKRDRFPSILDA